MSCLLKKPSPRPNIDVLHVCVVAQSLNHVRLCDPLNWKLPGSSVHGTFQTGILGWVAISSSRGSS